jgi:hypothetical protein
MRRGLNIDYDPAAAALPSAGVAAPPQQAKY